MYTLETLLRESRLPGPRGNLELLYAFAASGDSETVSRCLALIRPGTADSPEEFAGMCGVLGRAVLLSDRPSEALVFLRPYASHLSWRIREAVAMALQELMKIDPEAVLELLMPWTRGNGFERRAVVAGLCEPVLRFERMRNLRILRLLGDITRDFPREGKLEPENTALRKALAYGLSVIAVALPVEGKALFESLLEENQGKHLRWILRENIKKNRLIRIDPPWSEAFLRRLEVPAAGNHHKNRSTETGGKAV